MSFLNEAIKKAAHFAAKNSPAILTAVGVVGTVSTAYLTAKATFRLGVAVGSYNEQAEAHDAVGITSASELVDFVKERDDLWKAYIPAVITCTATLVCIVGANRIGSRRAATMAAAYSILERGATEYQAKVVEKFGEKREQEVRSEILADRLRERDPFEDDSIEVYGKPEGSSVFLDKFSNMHVWTSRDEIGAAMNDIGRTIVNVGYATLADFYYRMDMPAPAYASEIGWSSDDELPRPVYSSALTPANKPVNAFDFSVAPNPRYLRFR